MSAFRIGIAVLLFAWSLRLAYRLLGTLFEGSILVRFGGRELLVRRSEEPLRFWGFWLVGAAVLGIVAWYSLRPLLEQYVLHR